MYLNLRMAPPIVSTSLKRGNMRKDERNIKDWNQRIDAKKVTAFIAATRA